MSRFNGLLDAIFLFTRNWVLNNKLTFIADLSDGEKAKLIECGVSTKDTGEVKCERLYNLQVYESVLGIYCSV